MSTPQGAIVVGVDDSHQASKVVDWAYQEAALRQRPVHLVSGLILDSDSLVPPVDTRVLVADARRTLRDAFARQPEDFGLPVTWQLAGQAPARLLVETSEVADLVVVGTRGHGGFAGMLLGSVSQHVSRHAHCDVAVVRPVAAHALDDVVVGVDMSYRDTVVLRAAFQEARRRQVMLRVVHTWSPIRPADPRLGGSPVGFYTEDHRRGQHAQLDQLLRTWEFDHPDVKVAHESVAGHPVKVLADESGSSHLLVVGAHGAGRFGGVLLGSTASSLLHHAHCPVLVVR